MWRSMSLAPAPLALLHVVAAAPTASCLRTSTLQHSARALAAHTCARSIHTRAAQGAPTLLHARPARCVLHPTATAQRPPPHVAVRRASAPLVAALHTSTRMYALSAARLMRFLSRTSEASSAAPTSTSGSASASAAIDPADLSSSSPFDASHLLSNMEEKRENLHFLEVSSDGNYNRDVCFSRAELSSTLELHPRDLRFLDASMRNLPSILARKKVIIVNLEMFKALITADRVLMYDTWYPHVKGVVQPMQASVLNGGEKYDGQPVPFEFIALEHILLTVCRNLEQRFEIYLRSLAPLLSDSDSAASSSNNFLPSVSMLSLGGSGSAGDSDDGPASSSSSSSHSSPLGSSAQLNSLIADGSGSTLMHLLQLKNALTNFEVTLRETGGALRDLLETDEDMAQMYLTRKALTGFAIPPSSEHGEVEVILETYLRKVDELENEVEQMVKSITLTEEHIQIRLDSTRNSMMKLELLTSIGTFGVTSAALGAALFGMNVPNGFENSPSAFVGCTAVFLILAGLIIRKGLRVCRKRNIHLLQIEPQEPAFKFPYAAPDGPTSGAALFKNRRLAKIASLQTRGMSGGHDRF